MRVRTPEILRELRDNHELKQETLAQLLGVVQQTYSNYEKGNSALPLDHLASLAEYYKVSTDYLLGLNTFEKPATELDVIYAQDKTLGQVNNDLLKLSPERRRQMLDYLAYQLTREKEDKRKKKFKSKPQK